MVHEELRKELTFARDQTDALFRLISPEAIYSRPIAERHRLIFYLGHFEAFDWNLLARHSLSQPAFHPDFDQLFERGIDPLPGGAPMDSPRDWPSRTEVEQYGAETRKWLDAHLTELDPEALQMAIEHRHMHAETFACLLHGLPYDAKVALPSAPVKSRPAPVNRMIKIKAGVASLGQPAGKFGWDNERSAHSCDVPAFEISQFKISNGEYLEFVREGGPLPHFWVRKDDSFYFRGMFSEVPLALDQPVWVTWQQAARFAGWRDLALACEAQFQRAAAMVRPSPLRDNFGFQRWGAVAVDAGFDSAAEPAPVQMTGNGWEWTSDLFAPFAGFKAHPHYPGYSADFFDGQHYVLKGASPRTAALLARPSFRNWFRPEYPHVYAGFRLVTS